MFKEKELAEKNGMTAYVRLLDWIKLDCISFLNLIPFIGSIAAIVIYLILAFSSDVSESVKSRIKANLIWSGIALVLSIILLILSVGATVFLIDSLDPGALNPSVDFEQFSELFDV